MRFQLRPLQLSEDVARLVDLANLWGGEPFTAEQLLEQEKRLPVGMQQHRLVAVDETGTIIGYGMAERAPWSQEGQFHIMAITDLGFRGQGVGGALVGAVEAWALAQGATVFTTACRDHQAEARAFAEHRGYSLERHLFESTLDLATFEADRFAGVIDAAKEGGIRFFTLAEAPGEESERRLYGVTCKTSWDIPGFDLAADPPFADWRKRYIEDSQARMDLMIIAADGGRYVGATLLELNSETGALYTNYTGVDPEYRGRKLALALKLLGVEAARRYGAPYMRTNNDSLNEPMLAVNGKMGYVKEPGMYKMRKAL